MTAQETSETLNTPTFTLQGSQKKKREKGPEKIFEEIISKNLSNMGKKVVDQLQKAESQAR